MSLESDGSFAYTPNAGFAGTDSFLYVITDGVATAQATVTITVVEGSPVVGDDVYTVGRDGALNIAAPGSSATTGPDRDAISAVQFCGRPTAR